MGLLDIGKKLIASTALAVSAVTNPAEVLRVLTPERTANAERVLAAAVNPFSKEKVQATVSNKTVKAGLEFAANSPYTTAAVVATPFSTGAKAAVSGVISKLPTSVKLLGGAGSVVAAGALVSSEKTRVVAAKTAGGLTPEALLKTGGDVGRAIEVPSLENIKDIFTENPVATGALAGAGLIATAGLVPASLGAAIGAALGSPDSKVKVDIPSSLKASSPAAQTLPSAPTPPDSRAVAVAPPDMTAISPAKTFPAATRKRRKTYKLACHNAVSGRLNIQFRTGQC